MFNQSNWVHITPLVINSLGVDTHTDTHTHRHTHTDTHTHTDVRTETILRNQVHTDHWPVCAGLKNLKRKIWGIWEIESYLSILTSLFKIIYAAHSPVVCPFANVLSFQNYSHIQY